MNNTEKLRDHIESCGITGVKALQHEAEGEQYKTELLYLLEIMKTVTADEIRAAGYPLNIQNTLLMDRHLIKDTVTEEIDQLSLLNTVVTYIEKRWLLANKEKTGKKALGRCNRRLTD